MGNYLLTGAGFSHNWGGWLANETLEYLLGCRELDSETRKLLLAARRAGGGFEDALAVLQAETSAVGKIRLTAFMKALEKMFHEMESAFLHKPLEPQNQLHLMVRTFLMRFDAIFTLNQDTLLELHYLDDNIMLGSGGRWSGWEMPGMIVHGGREFPPMTKCKCADQHPPSIATIAYNRITNCTVQ